MKQILILSSKRILKFDLQVVNHMDPLHHFYIYLDHKKHAYYIHGTCITLKKLKSELKVNSTMELQSVLLNLLTNYTFEVINDLLILDSPIKLKIQIKQNTEKINHKLLLHFFSGGITCKDFEFVNHKEYLFIKQANNYYKCKKISHLVDLLDNYYPVIDNSKLMLINLKEKGVKILFYDILKINESDILSLGDY